jgi:carboxylesterase
MIDLKPFNEPEHQPFEMGQSTRAALLIHGFPGTPAEMRPLAKALADAGWHISAPLLPGHGPDIANLETKTRHDWIGHCRERWNHLGRNFRPRALVGFSIGGAISIHMASESEPENLVLIAPFWRIQDWRARLVPILKHFIPAMKPFEQADFEDERTRQTVRRISPDIDLDDPSTIEAVRDQFGLPLSTIDEIQIMGRDAFKMAKSIACPTTVVQGVDDEVARLSDTLTLIDQMANSHVYLEEVPGGHDLLADGFVGKSMIIDLVTNRLRSSI